MIIKKKTETYLEAKKMTWSDVKKWVNDEENNGELFGLISGVILLTIGFTIFLADVGLPNWWTIRTTAIIVTLFGLLCICLSVGPSYYCDSSIAPTTTTQIPTKMPT